MKVWILTEENNTGDSSHDTYIVDVFLSKEGAEAAKAEAEKEARELGSVILGDDEGDECEWDKDFAIEEHEAKP